MKYTTGTESGCSVKIDDKMMTKRKETGAFLNGTGCGTGAEALPDGGKRTKQTWADPILKESYQGTEHEPGGRENETKFYSKKAEIHRKWDGMHNRVRSKSIKPPKCGE